MQFPEILDVAVKKAKPIDSLSKESIITIRLNKNQKEIS